MNKLLRPSVSFLSVFLNERMNFWDCVRIEHGGMMLTMENRSARRKTPPSVTLSATNPIWSALGSSPRLCGVRSAATA